MYSIFFQTEKFLKDLNPLMWDDKKISRRIGFLSRQMGIWKGHTESDDIWPRGHSSTVTPWSDTQAQLYEDAIQVRRELHASVATHALRFAKRLSP